MHKQIMQRIGWICEDLGMTDREFAAAVNCTTKELEEPRFEVLQRILKNWPELNSRWLILGEGGTWFSLEDIDQKMEEVIGMEIKEMLLAQRVEQLEEELKAKERIIELLRVEE